MIRAARVFAAALVVTLGAAAVAAAPAAAHSDDGEMTVTRADATGDTTVEIEVGIVYTNDDDLATEATVTATATISTGATVGPIDVPNTNDALYAATIELPEAGVWTVSLSATDPTASATAEVDTTAVTPTTTAAPTTSMTRGPTTTVSAAKAPSPQAASAPEQDDSSAIPPALIAVIAIIIIAVGGAAFAYAQRRDSST